MTALLHRIMKASLLATIAVLISVASAFSQEATGKWTKKAHAIKGTWKIDANQIVLKDFATKKAPDLKLFLSPRTVSELNNQNAVKGSILVAKLKSSKGDQSYALPKGVDLSKYKTVIIHCERYSKLWGAAALTPARSGA